jgi:hypothetical protein
MSENDSLYNSLDAFVPNLVSKLTFVPSANKEVQARTSNTIANTIQHSQALKDSKTNPLSQAADGADYTGLGCFQLGLEVNAEQFEELLQAQRHLKELSLLQQLTSEDLLAIKKQIEVLQDARGSRALSYTAAGAVDDLLSMLSTPENELEPQLQIYIGLHSGFQTSADVQFWGLYDVDAESGGRDIYLSGFARDRAGAALHTFLSSQGCTRTECFMAEYAMAELNHKLSSTWHLPQRIVGDIEKLSPTEIILLHQRLSLLDEDDSFLLFRIRACCEYQLMDRPSMMQLRALNSKDYLSGNISIECLVQARLDWHREWGWAHPNPEQAIQLFQDVSRRLHETLMEGESELYGRIGTVMQAIMRQNHVDAGADLFALAVFCAFRQLALDEIYLEVLDRNAFPNHSTDQAGVFAENFAVGSRCDSFFDFSPRVLGTILSNRYRKYYMLHQPPDRVDGYTELPTTYAAMQVDSDPDFGNENISSIYKVTFLGIFAVPVSVCHLPHVEKVLIRHRL